MCMCVCVWVVAGINKGVLYYIMLFYVTVYEHVVPWVYLHHGGTGLED